MKTDEHSYEECQSSTTLSKFKLSLYSEQPEPVLANEDYSFQGM